MSRFCTAGDGACGVLVAEPNETRCSAHRVNRKDVVQLYVRQRASDEHLKIEGSVLQVENGVVTVIFGSQTLQIDAKFVSQLFSRRTEDGKGWMLEAKLSF